MVSQAGNEVQPAHFKEQMRAYDRWKAEVAHAIEEYQDWLTDHRAATPEIELRLNEIMASLKADKLTIAFVAEFSRGKTELINAIFFADYRRRLLPSEVGRTTMCPTELFYDNDVDEAYIRLLPIETRKADKSIAELRDNPDDWNQIPLDVNSPEQMAEALREVVRTKRVNVEEAKELGLYSEEFHGSAEAPEGSAQIDVPMWRHALISFPHPLLQQGLVILDTPGLNALGSEPELTVSMLPSAHAVLFVLAADTGVTRSDLDVWQYHITASRRDGHRGLVATLNKIDTLWDEMKEPAEVTASVENQCRATAKSLAMDAGSVFPVSAQKALVGKIRQDPDLVEQSRLLALESYLADQILPDKQAIVQDTIVDTVGGLIDNTISVMQGRFNTASKQLAELRSLSGRNSDVITNLMKKTRESQAAYNKNIESFQASKRILEQHSKAMLDALSVESVDGLVGKTRREMVDSWTTLGLKHGMRTFFDGVRDTMQQVSTQADQTHHAIQAIYRKFHEEHGLPLQDPKPFSLKPYRMELEALYEQAEAFRASPVTTMTEQSYVIKKFFISLVSHARHIFVRAYREADAWLKEIMVPLVKHINENKKMLDQHLETLCKINESRDNLDHKVRELENHCATLERELENLERIRGRLHTRLDNGLEEDTASREAV